jgi:hypothetical protein
MAFDGGLTAEEAAAYKRAKDDFAFFARKFLRIRTKGGSVVPFTLNRAQRFLHERLETQRRKTGRVRAVVLKGRQLGASTYIQGRFYWRLWAGRGLSAFILTHEQPATDNLFAMAQRFHDLYPDPDTKPKTKAANAKELAFADNDCSYAVATAGTKGVGRSATLQLFHGSEVGFWPNAETHIDGAFQAIADAAGTERILESTANGIGNVFQRRYAAAQRGDSDEEAIFVPWHWGEEYEREPGDWQPGPEWTAYGKAHKLTLRQLYWAFCKNRDMATAISEPIERPCWKFKQEYPASADEAFQTGGNSFIPADKVAAARKASVTGQGPLIIGVDPARTQDKTGVIDRRGRRLGELICARWDDQDTMVVAGKIVTLIKKHRPAAVNIDVGGLGVGIYDRLVEMGWGHVVNAVNFGSSPLGIGPTGDELYANRRAEMWDLKRAWYDTPGGVQTPDDDVFHADETSAVWGAAATRYGSNNELTLEPKDKIRERLGFSPDLGDAAALTFAVPVFEQARHFEDDAPRGRSGTTGY